MSVSPDGDAKAEKRSKREKKPEEESGSVKRESSSSAMKKEAPAQVIKPEASMIANGGPPAEFAGESSMNAGSPSKTTRGRRAVREGEYANVPAARRGWGAETEKRPLYENSAQANKVEFSPADEATAAAMQHNTAAALAAHEQLIAEVAQAPVDFHSAMPKQSELERATAAKFQSLLQQGAHDGVDLQCLMATLTGQFDDQDVAWEPDQLLLQLTSELSDRVAGDDEEGAQASFHDYMDPAQAQAYAASVQQKPSAFASSPVSAAAPGGRDRSGATASTTPAASSSSVSASAAVGGSSTAASASSSAAVAAPTSSSSAGTAVDSNASAQHGRRRKA